MTPELWQEVRPALDQAAELEPAARAAFLKELRQRDPAVGAEVESLLAQQPVPGPMASLADNLADLWPDGDTTKVGLTPVVDWPARIGPYAVEGELARGGMGVVLRARDQKFRRPVAVKILSLQFSRETSLARRFVEEAQIMGQLQHPGIPPVHDLGQLPDGRPFLAMKLIQGQTLAELLQAGKASPDGEPAPAPSSDSKVPADLPRFLAVFEQICQTMAYAHSRGVIHRDLKPANVMVGKFGEVQVMDWGLAKVLPRSSISGPTAANKLPDPMTVIRTARQSAGQLPDDSETQPGSVMGTPAYMAPEQARGEIDKLDERSDVFSLGAILCVVLTGQPPYARGDGRDTLERAIRADLAEAWQRLDACGADPQLVALTRRCLEPDLTNRLANASKVAAAIASYLQSVEARLKRAELERAQAEARATEENKRRLVERQKRRTTVALAATVLLLLTGGVAAGLWYQGEQNRQAAEANRLQAEKDARQQYLEKEATEALEQAETIRHALYEKLAKPQTAAELLSNLDRWKKPLNEAQAAWQRADFVISKDAELAPAKLQDLVAELKRQLDTDWHDFQKAKLLDDIRLGMVSGTIKEWRAKNPAKVYPPLFAEWGLDVAKAEPAALVAKIKNSPSRFALAAALDFWATRLSKGSKLLPKGSDLLARLLAFARGADPDPWRDRLRDPAAWNNLPKLHALAAEVKHEQQTSQILLVLGLRLEETGAVKEGAAVLRKALVYYPGDFWLHHHLAFMVQGTPEEIGCFRAALALRPESSAANYNLGWALIQHKDLKGAFSQLQKALALDPASPLVYQQLADVLRKMNDFDGANVYAQKALACDLNDAENNRSAGLACHDKKDWDKAAAYFQKAIALDPSSALAHENLGYLLEDKNDPVGAVAEYRKAIALDPTEPLSYLNLTHALISQGKYLEVVSACKEGFAAAPKMADEREYSPFFIGAQAAIGAASDQDKTAGGLKAEEKAALRQQALAWFKTEIALLPKGLHASPKGFLTARTRLVILRFNPFLDSVRDEKLLAMLPELERKDWQKLWAKIDSMLQYMQVSLPEVSKWEGNLTAEKKEEAYTVKLAAGKHYLLDMKSKKLDAYLKLEDAQGTTLAEDDDGGGMQDAALIFTPPQTGTYRLVATSFNKNGVGPYTVVVSEFMAD